MKIYFLTAFVLLFLGCNSASNEYGRNSGITHGTVQLNLQKGVTTQTQVLEAFGSPNIVTTDGETEVWTYQRSGVTTRSANAGLGLVIIFAGTGGSSTNSRTMTLIIKFDEAKRVIEYNSRYSSF
jgi:outer membrane protein assembly factor BamE (lipoprotein component of BamABCDE complex)